MGNGIKMLLDELSPKLDVFITEELERIQKILFSSYIRYVDQNCDPWSCWSQIKTDFNSFNLTSKVEFDLKIAILACFVLIDVPLKDDKEDGDSGKFIGWWLGWDEGRVLDWLGSDVCLVGWIKEAASEVGSCVSWCETRLRRSSVLRLL